MLSPVHNENAVNFHMEYAFDSWKPLWRNVLQSYYESSSKVEGMKVVSLIEMMEMTQHSVAARNLRTSPNCGLRCSGGERQDRFELCKPTFLVCCYTRKGCCHFPSWVGGGDTQQT
ncbi:Hypothetical predicted protein [Podarcis lilfordi]|uniref:Uncharacterized protein n=1 Tax=Podarcis lilfordi TaxID=74358 RepID=A0AA35KEF5_9SAUR|nr:Hypothetical predicted protein [Podarcis lilfordi]